MEALNPAGSSADLPVKVKDREERMNASRKYIHCGKAGIVDHGKSSGLTRFRCRSKTCGKTWTALTGTPLARLRKRKKWER